MFVTDHILSDILFASHLSFSLFSALLFPSDGGVCFPHLFIIMLLGYWCIILLRKYSSSSSLWRHLDPGVLKLNTAYLYHGINIVLTLHLHQNHCNSCCYIIDRVLLYTRRPYSCIPTIYCTIVKSETSGVAWVIERFFFAIITIPSYGVIV